MFKKSLILGLGLWLTACNGSSSSDKTAEAERAAQASRVEFFFQKANIVDVEVWYQETAKPFSKESGLDRDIWQILRANLTEILKNRTTPPTITVPSTLAEMHPLSAAVQANWTLAQIKSLYEGNQTGATPEGTARFHIYFLDGYYNDGEGSNTNVIGVSLTGTNIIAMFKPVIESTRTGVTELVPKYVEQSTLVHEMGHALGFVDNGVPMVTPHRDTEHGAHTTNQDCVMYWLNEGVTDMKAFVQKAITEQSLVLWGPEVLADAKAFSK